MVFAYQEAVEAWHREPPGITWDKMINHHLDHPAAWVLSGPGFFVAARVVWSDWEDDLITDCDVAALAGDMLHVSVVAGDLKSLLGFIPGDLRKRLDWMSFQRVGRRVHRWNIDRLMAGGGM